MIRRAEAKTQRRLRWEQVEPQLAHRAATAMVAQGTTEGLEETNRQELIWSMTAFFFAVVVVAVYLNIVLHLSGPTATMIFSMAPLLLIALIAIPEIRNAARENVMEVKATRPVKQPRGLLTENVIRQVFPTVVQTPMENLYTETLALLTNVGDGIVGERTGRELLTHCNRLLTSSRRLETHRQRIQNLLHNAQSVTEISSEYDTLTLRYATETDPVTRQSLQESATLCAERLETAHALEATLARLQAHEGMIEQAFLLAQAALVREQAALVAAEKPDVTGLRETVRQVARETAAVEEAVAEVVRLR